MGFDYLNDLFGQFRKKKTKFSEVEKRATSLLSKYARGSIQKDEFGNQMEQVDDEFGELMTDEAGCIVFDQDTPLWLNLFLGNKFRRWNHVRKVINAARQKPEITSSPDWVKALQVMDAEDRNLMEAVRYCLDELK